MSINPALDIARQQSATSGESRFNKILKGDAPPLMYLGGNKGPTKMMIPSIVGGDDTLTYGTFVNDTVRKTGMLPLLYDYAMDWVYVYQNMGVGDSSRRMSILAVNTITDEEGNERILAEQAWGNGYKSPMYRLQEYLWKTSGSPKFNKRQNRVEYTTPILNPAAAELFPAGNSLDAPVRRATRCLLLQGLVFENAGTNYTTDPETGQAKWPEHRIFMVNQVTAINSATHMENKVGFYDKFLMQNDGAIVDPSAIASTYGDTITNVEARRKWEKDAFYHSDYATNPKLVEFSSQPSGAAGITAYSCAVNNMSDIYGPEYKLSVEVTQNVKPLSQYLYPCTEELQIEWLKELFAGYEWSLIGAGLMSESPTAVAVPSQPTVTAPVAPAAPAATVAPAAPGVPTAPTAAIPTPVVTPTPETTAPAGNMDAQMQKMMDRLQGLTNPPEQE